MGDLALPLRIGNMPTSLIVYLRASTDLKVYRWSLVDRFWWLRYNALRETQAHKNPNGDSLNTTYTSPS